MRRIFLNGEALFRKQTIKYRSVNLSFNMTLSTQIHTVFFNHRFRFMKFHKSLMANRSSALILCCPPIMFPGRLYKYLTSIKKCLRLLSTSSGVAYSSTCKVLISQHLNLCKRLSYSIINDQLHPLYLCLANALSSSSLDLL